MNAKEEKCKYNKCQQEIDEECKNRKIIETKFSKEKKNSDIMMFGGVDLKNLNARICMIYYINDIITTSSIIIKTFFEFESFSNKENAAQTNAQTKNFF